MEATFEPKIVAFVCNWCTYTGADLAGTSRLQYDPNVRLIRLPCTGRISPLFVMKALEQGADGVLVSGCHPGDCHYTAGNYHARRKYTVLRELLQFIGIEPERVQFSWVSAAEGKKWTEVVDRVTADVRKLGPRPYAWGEWDREWQGRKGGKGPVPSTSNSPVAVVEDPAAFRSLEAELRAKARELLERGEVGVVVGYRQGTLPGITRPAFITSPPEVEQLVWNEHCLQNLSVYLTNDLVTRLGRVGLVVKGCDEKSVIGLLQENQVAREEVVLVGMVCPGMESDGGLAAKCRACDVRTPAFADHVIGQAPPPAEAEDPRWAEIAQLEQMSYADRWNFWQAQFANCLRCYACRAACPLCFCERCLADKTQPRWIPSQADGKGNLSWHVVRALHLAGRCVDCGSCMQSCPAHIRLDLLNLKMAHVVRETFGYVAGHDPTAAPPLTIFREDDPQDFIH